MPHPEAQCLGELILAGQGEGHGSGVPQECLHWLSSPRWTPGVSKAEENLQGPS